jgi:MinD-like ATPase involved in chromosome partitioning or flagellar assembly
MVLSISAPPSISVPLGSDISGCAPRVISDQSLPLESGGEWSAFPGVSDGALGGEVVSAPAFRARPVPHEFGPADVAERTWLRAASLQPAAVVAVSSADGGVGRSTLVAALGGVLALAVPDQVIAVDMNPVPWGGLGERIGRSSAGTMWDAVRDLHTLTSRREIERWTQHSPSGLLALVGETEGRRRRPPRHDEAAAVVEAVRRLYPLTVCDVMPALITGVWRTLAAAHTPVLVARATTDSLHHTMRLFALLRAGGHGSVVDGGVLAVVATSPVTDRDVRAVVQQATAVIPAVVPIPFDPLLARPEPVDVRRLRKPTRHALVQLADAVIQGCAGPPPELPITISEGDA